MWHHPHGLCGTECTSSSSIPSSFSNQNLPVAAQSPLQLGVSTCLSPSQRAVRSFAGKVCIRTLQRSCLVSIYPFPPLRWLRNGGNQNSCLDIKGGKCLLRMTEPPHESKLFTLGLLWKRYIRPHLISLYFRVFRSSGLSLPNQSSPKPKMGSMDVSFLLLSVFHCADHVPSTMPETEVER